MLAKASGAGQITTETGQPADTSSETYKNNVQLQHRGF
jgi:hypothetical protein